MKKLTAYKGFDKGLVCRGFQYKVGKLYKHDGEIGLCKQGFHACEQPLDVFNYYPPEDGREYAVVEQSGKTEKGDDKTVSSKISIKATLSLKDLWKAQIDFVFSKVKRSERAMNTSGNEAHANTSGYRAHANTSGYRAHANTSGKRAHANTSGERAHASTSGKRAHASTSGYRAHANTSGNEAHANTSGYRAHANTSGNEAHANTSGNEAHANTSGDWAHANTSGDWAHANTSGNEAHASTSGNRAHASTSGKNSTVACLGFDGKAKAGDNGVIILTYFDEKAERHRVVVGYVGENDIKKDIWYQVEDGELVECEL